MSTREQITRALADWNALNYEQAADALLPLVDRLRAEAAAEALEASAAEWAADPDAVGDSEADARNWLRERAAALRAEAAS